MKETIDSKYLDFVEREQAVKRKTQIWQVLAKSRDEEYSGLLGEVRWYSPWRQYCFFPEDATVWNVQCLQDVRLFMQRKTAFHRLSYAAR